MKTLEEKLKEMIVERLFLKIQSTDIGDEQALEDFGVDSVMIFEMVIGLEEEMGVVFEEEEFDVANFRTVKSIADSIREKEEKE